MEWNGECGGCVKSLVVAFGAFWEQYPVALFCPHPLFLLSIVLTVFFDSNLPFYPGVTELRLFELP
jgi:hypothetical protein